MQEALIRKPFKFPNPLHELVIGELFRVLSEEQTYEGVIHSYYIFGIAAARFPDIRNRRQLR